MTWEMPVQCEAPPLLLELQKQVEDTGPYWEGDLQARQGSSGHTACSMGLSSQALALSRTQVREQSQGNISLTSLALLGRGGGGGERMHLTVAYMATM